MKIEDILNNETLKKHLEEFKKYNDEYIKRVNKKAFFSFSKADSIIKKNKE